MEQKIEKKNKKKYLMLSIVVLLVLNIIFLVGKITYTGKVVTFIEPLCTDKSECLPNQECCKFHDEEAGVCEHPANCNVVDEITKNTEPAKIETPKQFSVVNYIPILISVIVLIIVLIIYFR